MTDEQKDALLAAVRNYLDITYDDPDGDEKLKGIIARGIAYLDRIAGGALYYLIESNPRQLLFDYVRYVRSNALDEFKVNYQSELLALQIDCEVARYAEK